MIRFQLAAVLKRRGWTPYRLAQETGLTVPTAYRLADPNMEFGRFTADTLDRLCAALGVQPGELLEWAPDRAWQARRVTRENELPGRHAHRTGAPRKRLTANP